jgi:3-oxoacyl-[acyl-carrier protein] reductase
VGREGVRVVCLQPHAIPESVATSHLRDVFGSVAQHSGTTVEAWLSTLADSALLGRLPTLDQVVDFATFAASDRAGAMTGAIANITSGVLVD